MNIADFIISLSEVEKTLKSFDLFRMRGIKSINGDGVSPQFKLASIKDDYINAYTEGLRYNDYDFLLNDQSYFQFEFKKTDSFIDIRYAFFHNPINYITYSEYIQEQLKTFGMMESPEEIGTLLEEEYNQFLNEQDLKLNYTTIRYDSDYGNYKPLVHSVSHIHIGHSNNMRIPINKIISPLNFVLFTIKHVYYQEWKGKVKTDLDYIKERMAISKHGEQNLPNHIWDEMEKIELYLN